MSAAALSLENALVRWRNNLIDLTRRNPLLSLRQTHGAYLEIAQPSADNVFEAVVNKGKSFTFWLPPLKEEPATSSEPALAAHALREDAGRARPTAVPRASELVTAERDRQRLMQTLTYLYRRY